MGRQAIKCGEIWRKTARDESPQGARTQFCAVGRSGWTYAHGRISSCQHGSIQLRVSANDSFKGIDSGGTERNAERHWGRSMIPKQEAEGHDCSKGKFTEQQAASWFTCMTFDPTVAAQMPYRPTSPSSPPCSTPSVRRTFARSISMTVQRRESY